MVKKIRKSIVVVSLVLIVIASAFAKAAIPVIHAQDNPAITLDDKTPSVDVVITPDKGAPGTVYVDLQDPKERVRPFTAIATVSVIRPGGAFGLV